MKVFIAGATGVLGRRTVTRMADAGHEVTGIARNDEKAELLDRLGVRPARVDLFDPAGVKDAVAGHDVVCNLATHIPPSSKALRAAAWAENDRIRREGSANLVDAALAAGAGRYVQESITFVYPDRGDQWIDENEPVEPSPLVESVLDSQASTDRFTSAGKTGVFLRFGSFYSADSLHTEEMFRWARRGVSTELGPRDAYKSSIHVDDAAAVVVAALEVPAGVYNVVDDEPLTRGEHIDLVASLVGRRRLMRLPDKLSVLAASKSELLKRSQRVSNARLRAATGWAPRHPSVRDGFPVVRRELAAVGGV